MRIFDTSRTHSPISKSDEGQKNRETKYIGAAHDSPQGIHFAFDELTVVHSPDQCIPCIADRGLLHSRVIFERRKRSIDDDDDGAKDKLAWDDVVDQNAKIILKIWVEAGIYVADVDERL